MGISRELAAALGLAFKEQNLPLTEADENISDLIDVQIWDEDLCPRYIPICDVPGYKFLANF